MIKKMFMIMLLIMSVSMLYGCGNNPVAENAKQSEENGISGAIETEAVYYPSYKVEIFSLSVPMPVMDASASLYMNPTPEANAEISLWQTYSPGGYRTPSSGYLKKLALDKLTPTATFDGQVISPTPVIIKDNKILLLLSTAGKIRAYRDGLMINPPHTRVRYAVDYKISKTITDPSIMPYVKKSFQYSLSNGKKVFLGSVFGEPDSYGLSSHIVSGLIGSNGTLEVLYEYGLF